MQNLKKHRTAKILPYILIGAFLFYINAAEISGFQSIQKRVEDESKAVAANAESNAETLVEAIQASPDTPFNVEQEYSPRFKGKLGKQDYVRKSRGSGWIVVAVLALAAAGVMAYLLLTEEDENESSPDVSLTVEVHHDNTFDVVADGVTLGTIPWNTVQTFDPDMNTGSHNVLLRAKEIEDCKVTLSLSINNPELYRFSAASITNGIWDEFSFSDQGITGVFWHDRAVSLNTDFSFSYTIVEK